MLEYNGGVDFDVSAHSAGFLMMMVSTPEYTLANPARETLLTELEHVIKKWGIDMAKGVKFRYTCPHVKFFKYFYCC